MTEKRKYGRAVVDTRVAARRVLREIAMSDEQPLVLVALSGGADSLALALAVAYEAPRRGVRAGAIIVDHGLQEASAAVAATAAAQAREMGLDPVVISRVTVDPDPGGPEAAARDARYRALAAAAAEHGAGAILTAHTRDDQAEQVLLGLARGSGSRSLAGIPPERALGERAVIRRPFLASDPVITRAVTEAACNDQGVEFWRDPHNDDPRYARVRVRARVLPVFETELGPGVAAALARTADLVREDADALDDMAAEYARGLLAGETYETYLPPRVGPTGDPVTISVADLTGIAPAVLYRVIRVIAEVRFGSYLGREHTLAIADLVTKWRGQDAAYVPGIIVTREGGSLNFEPQVGSPRD